MARREKTPSVVIVGAGHAGLLLALALDQAGVAVDVIDRDAPDDVLRPAFDGRALALMYGSKRVFDALGLWAAIAPDATAVWGVRVRDPAAGGAIAYDAREVGDHPFAFGIENRRLRARLLALATERPGIELLAPATLERLERGSDATEVVLGDGRRRRAPLVVGADGRRSTIRRLAGIGVDRRPYRQTALTFAIRHARPHDDLVREFLRPAGPLALLPIGPRLCSVTWIEREETARWLLAGTRAQLEAALADRLGDALGDFEIVGEPAGHPLTLQHARRSVAHRLALIGDAAHGIHPIHAQGFNLGVRDVAALAEILVDARRRGADLGDAEGLLRYARWRESDVRLVAGMTDGLNRLFSTDLAPARLVRGLGLAALDRMPPLKQLAIRRGMGLVGDLPRLARGEAL